MRELVICFLVHCRCNSDSLLTFRLEVSPTRNQERKRTVTAVNDIQHAVHVLVIYTAKCRQWQYMCW